VRSRRAGGELGRTGRRGAFSRRGARRAAGGGFTLIELVLVLTLVAFLAMMSWITFAGRQDDTDFEEGVNRFESSLRLARAESASLGLRLRFSFDANGAAQILYEPKPLEAPGEFVVYVACPWGDIFNGRLALVSRCERTGSSAYRSGGMGTGNPGDQAVLEDLTFYPDGTSDSALVELSPPDGADPRRAVIELGGLDGAIRTLTTFVDFLPDTYDQIYLEEYPDANQSW